MNNYIITRSRQRYLVPTNWNGFAGTGKRTRDILGYARSHMLMYYRHGHNTLVSWIDETEQAEKYISDQIIHDQTYLPRVVEGWHKAESILVLVSEKILHTDYSQASRQDLLKAYRDVMEGWVENDAWNVQPWFAGSAKLERYIRDSLRQQSIELSEEAFITLCTCPQLSVGADEELAILRVLANLRSINQAANQLAKQFYWLPFGYDGPTLYTAEHYVSEIKRRLATNSASWQDRLRELESYEIDLKKKQQKIIKQHNIPDEIGELLKRLQTLQYMADRRKYATSVAQVAFDHVARAIAHNRNVDLYEIKSITLPELEELWDDQEAIARLGKKRLTNSVIFSYEDGNEKVLSDAEIATIEKELFPPETAITEIKGQVGAKGARSIVQGTVKIAHTLQEAMGIEEGQILVTGMTTPDFVSAMRRAAAIVTDEGGVTCHAAIIARELHIPCIIGTKNATQVLKDGDLVEVDANSGKVRIIK